MSDNAITFAQLLQEIQQVFPDAREGYVMRLLNNIVGEITTERNLKKKEKLINSVNGQMLYDMDETAKIFRVDFVNNDGDYIMIPRLLDGEFIRKWDPT